MFVASLRSESLQGSTSCTILCPDFNTVDFLFYGIHLLRTPFYFPMIRRIGVRCIGYGFIEEANGSN